MKINHIALYVNDMAKMRNFYELYFDGQLAKEVHCEKEKATKSFLMFADNSYIELIKLDASQYKDMAKETHSMAHIGFSLKDKNELDRLCLRLKQNKYTQVHEVEDDKRGAYTACFSDPEGNKVEITAPAHKNN